MLTFFYSVLFKHWMESFLSSELDFPVFIHQHNAAVPCCCRWQFKFQVKILIKPIFQLLSTDMFKPCLTPKFLNHLLLNYPQPIPLWAPTCFSVGKCFHALLYTKEVAQNHSSSQMNPYNQSSRVMNSACAVWPSDVLKSNTYRILFLHEVNGSWLINFREIRNWPIIFQKTTKRNVFMVLLLSLIRK